MIQLSLAAKESIKTGMAMSTACGLAMAAGWTNPYWACIAVAVVSLSTVGESLNKCVHRLWGTLAAGALGLLFLGLFPQDRWAFITCLSLYMGLSAYKVTTSRYVYFWFLSGYVVLLIASATVGTSSQHAFNTVMVRIQETVLGIVVYALVSVFLWPQRSSHDLKLVVKSLLGVQAKTLQQYFSLMLHKNGVDRTETLYSLENQLVGQLKRRLDAAETEQFEIHEARGWWRQLIAQFQALMEAMELWRESFPELRQLDLKNLLPDLPVVRDALQLRFERLLALADDAPIDQESTHVALTLDAERLQSLSHLQRAAVLTTNAALQQIEAVSRSLSQCLLAIQNPRRGGALPPKDTSPSITRQADSDSFAAIVRGVAAVWLSSLIWIYIDPPGHMAFVVFVGLFTLMGIMMPQMNWLKFLLYNSTGVIIASLLYIFVMPNLSGYLEFSILFFVLTTTIYYISWHPRLTMLKLAGIVPFIMLTNIQNHQTYSFSTFANNTATMLLGLLFAAAISNIPFSLRPEKMFLRVMARYFRQAGHFLSLFDTEPAKTNEDARKAFALSAMQASVSKMGGWANSINYRAMPTNPPEKAAALVASLNTITYRCIVLADTRKQHRPLWEYFGGDIRTWSTAIKKLLQHWACDPLHSDVELDLQTRLQTECIHLENSIEKTFQTVADALTEDEYAEAYRLLGGYRGLYEALLTHAALAADFDWDSWRESRF